MSNSNKNRFCEWVVFSFVCFALVGSMFEYLMTGAMSKPTLLALIGSIGAASVLALFEQLEKNRFRNLIIGGTAALLLLSLSINPAAAADAALAASASKMPMGEWINSGKSAANGLLCATVGDPIGLFGCSGDGKSPIWSIIKTFNLAVFAFAALWMCWNVLAGVMSSAADGEFLGKRQNSTWVPIRLVIGFSMIIPVFKGWNLAQLVMLWAAAVGSGIAGSIATSVATTVNWGGSYFAPPLIKAVQIETEIIDGLRCLKEKRDEFAGMVEEGVMDTDIAKVKWTHSVKSTLDPALVMQIDMGVQDQAGGYLPDQCGQVLISFINPSDTRFSKDDPNVVTIATTIQSFVNDRIKILVDDYAKAVDNVTLASDQDKTFIAIRQGFDADVAFTADKIVAGINAFNGSTAIKTSIERYGWVGLGFQGVHATRTAIQVGRSTQSEVSKAKGTNAASGSGKAKADNGVSFKDPTTWLNWTINGALNSMVDSLGNGVAARISGFSGTNPMAALQSLGVTIVAWVAALGMWILFFPVIAGLAAMAVPLAGSLLASLPFVGGGAASAAATASTFLGGMITSITGVLTLIWVVTGIPLLFFGLKLAAYIPFLVAIMWCGAILAWLMIVFESLIGAPLWALVHLDTDGEGMGQKTTHGYLFLLNLIFRPIVLVFSLACAMVSMNAIFALFGSGVAAMITDMSTSSKDWFANLLMIVGAIAVVVFAAETIIMQSLSLLWNIPNNVFTWLGAQFGSNVGQGMEGGANAAGSAIQGAGKHAGDAAGANEFGNDHRGHGRGKSQLAAGGAKMGEAYRKMRGKGGGEIERG